MANPYPAKFLDDGGEIRLAGSIDFDDPGNQPGGSSVTGMAVQLVSFPFAFNTPGLAAGVSVYTPSVGDILFEAWIEVTTAFDGTTPSADISQFTGAAAPGGLWFNNQGVFIDLTGVDSTSRGGGPAGGSTVNTGSVQLSNVALDNYRAIPGRFTTVAPLKLVVSQTGLQGGTAIDSTVGAATLRALIIRPT